MSGVPDNSPSREEFRDIGTQYSAGAYSNDQIFIKGDRNVQARTIRRKFNILSRAENVICQAEIWADGFNLKGETRIRDILNLDRPVRSSDMAILYAYSYLKAVSLGYHYQNSYGDTL